MTENHHELSQCQAGKSQITYENSESSSAPSLTKWRCRIEICFQKQSSNDGYSILQGHQYPATTDIKKENYKCAISENSHHITCRAKYHKQISSTAYLCFKTKYIGIEADIVHEQVHMTLQQQKNQNYKMENVILYKSPNKQNSCQPLNQDGQLTNAIIIGKKMRRTRAHLKGGPIDKRQSYLNKYILLACTIKILNKDLNWKVKENEGKQADLYSHMPTNKIPRKVIHNLYHNDQLY